MNTRSNGIARSIARLGNDAFSDDFPSGAHRAARSARGGTSTSCRIAPPKMSDFPAPPVIAPLPPPSSPMIPLPSEASAEMDAECQGCLLVFPARELAHDARFAGTLCVRCHQGMERAQARRIASEMPKLPRRGATQFHERGADRYLKLAESAYRNWRKAPSAESTQAIIVAIGQRMQALSESEANDG